MGSTTCSTTCAHAWTRSRVCIARGSLRCVVIVFTISFLLFVTCLPLHSLGFHCLFAPLALVLFCFLSCFPPHAYREPVILSALLVLHFLPALLAFIMFFLEISEFWFCICAIAHLFPQPYVVHDPPFALSPSRSLFPFLVLLAPSNRTLQTLSSKSLSHSSVSPAVSHQLHSHLSIVLCHISRLRTC